MEKDRSVEFNAPAQVTDAAEVSVARKATAWPPVAYNFFWLGLALRELNLKTPVFSDFLGNTLREPLGEADLTCYFKAQRDWIPEMNTVSAGALSDATPLHNIFTQNA